MDTVKIDGKGSCRIIAHRGVSGLEPENTVAAFVAAGNRSYFGIETDVRVTRDGQYVVNHDGDLKRVAGVDLVIEEATLAEIQAVPLLDSDGVSHRTDLRTPLLSEYIGITRRYEKEAILELKGDIAPEHIAGIVAVVEGEGWLTRTTFISFHPDNLLRLRAVCPTAKAQFLPSENAEWIFRFVAENRFGLDIYHKALTKEMVDMAHAAGLTVNCWTVDTPEDAARMLALGVDQITTNILE